MPDLEWNKKTWNDTYDWKNRGEEWSKGFGNSLTQWHGFLLPRINENFPCGNFLEIAPGFGRWTKFILPHVRTYVGIDLSRSAIDSCKEHFLPSWPDSQFIVNDGMSLKELPDIKYDFIFSFDSLVHAPLEAVDAYIGQILSMGLLKDDAVCFLHHSNLKFAASINKSILDRPFHCRSLDTSFVEIENSINNHGGCTLSQELLIWGGIPDLDCITMFCAKNSTRKRTKTVFRNMFPEAELCKQVLAHYNYPYHS